MSDGISVRFMRAYAPDHDAAQTPMDMALMLASRDERDIPFAEKLSDAIAFIAERKRNIQ